jgi:hypothetical protein
VICLASVLVALLAASVSAYEGDGIIEEGEDETAELSDDKERT